MNVVDQKVLDQELIRRGLTYENRALPVAVEPFLISKKRYDHFKTLFQSLHFILEKVLLLSKTQVWILDYLNIDERFRFYLRNECSYRPFIHFSRYDFTIDKNQRPRIYELNCDCPAGLLFSKELFSILCDTSEIVQEKLRNLEWSPFPMQYMSTFSESLLELWGEQTSKKIVPVVGLINCRDNPLVNELSLMEKELRLKGMDVKQCHIQDLSCVDERLVAGDRILDVIFHKFDNPKKEFETAFSLKKNEILAYNQSVETNTTVRVNSYESMFLAENKAILALIQSPRLQSFLTEDECGIINEIIPPTYLLRELSDDQIKSISSDWQNWVLKKCLDTRGRSVRLGPNVTFSEWQQCFNEAMNSPDDYIVQQFEKSLIDSEKKERMYTTLAEYMVRGRPTGLVVRTSYDEITNVGLRGQLRVPFICNED